MGLVIRQCPLMLMAFRVCRFGASTNSVDLLEPVKPTA
jgi:hypothetical protein